MAVAARPRLVEIEYTRPWLYPAQRAALFHGERYGVCEASTKAGKTVGCMAWLLEQAFVSGRPGHNFWWVAPIRNQARIAYERMKHGLPADRFVANESDLTILLPNGTRLRFTGAERPDSLYGEDVYAAVIDEASRVREESWHAVRSTLTATQGPIRIIGNVRGRKNWAFKLARRAEAGEPGMRYAKLTAYDAVAAGVFPLEEVEDARRVLPEDVFRELYLAEPSDDGGNPFGIGAIEACLAPLSSRLPVGWGVDLAKSVDWTVAIGLDADNAVSGFERFQKPWEETMVALRRVTAGAPALVDSTGVGDPVLEGLQRGGGRYEGFKFSSSSKQQLMEGLAVAIQQGRVRFPDGPIRRELESFEYEYTRMGVRYSAPAGLHDDCVCSLALAVKQCGQRVSIWAA